MIKKALTRKVLATILATITLTSSLLVNAAEPVSNNIIKTADTNTISTYSTGAYNNYYYSRPAGEFAVDHVTYSGSKLHVYASSHTTVDSVSTVYLVIKKRVFTEWMEIGRAEIWANADSHKVFSGLTIPANTQIQICIDVRGSGASNVGYSSYTL